MKFQGMTGLMTALLCLAACAPQGMVDEASEIPVPSMKIVAFGSSAQQLNYELEIKNDGPADICIALNEMYPTEVSVPPIFLDLRRSSDGRYLRFSPYGIKERISKSSGFKIFNKIPVLSPGGSITVKGEMGWGESRMLPVQRREFAPPDPPAEIVGDALEPSEPIYVELRVGVLNCANEFTSFQHAVARGPDFSLQ